MNCLTVLGRGDKFTHKLPNIRFGSIRWVNRDKRERLHILGDDGMNRLIIAIDNPHHASTRIDTLHSFLSNRTFNRMTTYHNGLH
uniref:Uncharacterized protein n=1 Tax=Anopheles dirus TaxID=7168 RepID=A0A182NX18_9DIPT